MVHLANSLHACEAPVLSTHSSTHRQMMHAFIGFLMAHPALIHDTWHTTMC